MQKNTKIFIGILAIAGIGYLIYKNKKSNSASGNLSTSEKTQAEKDEAAIAAKPEAEQRTVYSQDASDLADMIAAPDFSELSFDGTAPANTASTDQQKQSLEVRQQVAAKLKNLIAQNALTIDDLKTIHDFVLAKKKKYPGKKSKGELNSSLHSIFHRYGIDLPENVKSDKDTKNNTFLGLRLPKLSIRRNDSITDHQAAIK